MCTILFYHASGIRGYYTRTDYQNGQVIFTIRQAPEDCRCSACGSSHVVSRGGVERRFRMSASPRRPPPAPPISRRREPSRLQYDSLISVYSLVMPNVSCRLGFPARRPDRDAELVLRDVPSGRLRARLRAQNAKELSRVAFTGRPDRGGGRYQLVD